MDINEKSETKKQTACIPCKIIGIIVLCLAAYGLYNLILLFL